MLTLYILLYSAFVILLFLYTQTSFIETFNRGRQPASWKWCPPHQAGLDLFAHLAYPVEFTYHPLPAIPFPQLNPIYTSSDPSADPHWCSLSTQGCLANESKMQRSVLKVLRFSSSSSPLPFATDPITCLLDSLSVVDTLERCMTGDHQCRRFHGHLPEAASTCSLDETSHAYDTAIVPASPTCDVESSLKEEEVGHWSTHPAVPGGPPFARWIAAERPAHWL